MPYGVSKMILNDTPEELVNRLGGLSLSGKSVVRLTDRPDMTLDVYRGRKTTTQQQQHNLKGTVKGNRKSGRQKKRWEDNIKEWTGIDLASSTRLAKTGKGLLQSHLWFPDNLPCYRVEQNRNRTAFLKHGFVLV